MLTVPLCLADISSTACKIGWLEKGSIAHTLRYVIKVFHYTPNLNLGFLSLWGLKLDPPGVTKSKTYLQGLYTQKLIHNVVKQKGCMYVYKSTLKQHTLLCVRNTCKHSITRHATKKKKIQAGNLILLQWHSSICLSLLLCVLHNYETFLVMLLCKASQLAYLLFLKNRLGWSHSYMLCLLQAEALWNTHARLALRIFQSP